MEILLITCYLRYIIDLAKIKEFEQYARLWIALIEKFGGRHHGYFLPGEGPTASFSFPGVGVEGLGDVAVALFSFSSQAAYDTYRQQAAQDSECQAATAYYRETKCFVSYERSFMKAVFK